jgi:hypothetical protein
VGAGDGQVSDLIRSKHRDVDELAHAASHAEIEQVAIRLVVDLLERKAVALTRDPDRRENELDPIVDEASERFGSGCLADEDVVHLVAGNGWCGEGARPFEAVQAARQDAHPEAAPLELTGDELPEVAGCSGYDHPRARLAAAARLAHLAPLLASQAPADRDTVGAKSFVP